MRRSIVIATTLLLGTLMAAPAAHAQKSQREIDQGWANFMEDLTYGRLSRIIFPPISDRQYKRWERQREKRARRSNQAVPGRSDDSSADIGGE